MSHELCINENSVQCFQPEKIMIPLKPHQLAMIHAMSELETSPIIKVVDVPQMYDEDLSFTTNFGALCDKVGSGKSLSILGLIAHQKLLPIKPRCINSFGNMISQYSTFKNNLPINLLVVPHGIVGQWEKYIVEQTTLSKSIIKNKSAMGDFTEKLKHYISTRDSSAFTEDIILLSNTFYKKLSQLLRDININRLLVDEVETIKIPASFEIRAQFTWFISSSIQILQNPSGVYSYEPYGYVNYMGNYVTSSRRVLKDKMPHTGFFKDTLTNVSQVGFRNQVYLKCEEDFITQSFLLPPIETYQIKCKDTIYSHVLNGLVSQDVMAMINAGDIEGAIESSGIEQTNSENLVELLTNEFQNKLHNKKIELEAKEKMTYSTAENKRKALEKIKKQIEELENKIDCIKKRVLETEGCPICFDEIKNRVILTCCGNPFCYECLTLSLNSIKTCPLCRSHVQKKDMIFIQEECCKHTDKMEELDKDENRTKLENLDYYLEKVLAEPGLKSILIFSEYEKSLLDMENILKAKNLKYRHLKGQTKFIENSVTLYKENKLDILLLNSKYFGSGLNLENTTHLFMFHKMKSHLDKQVIGRAQRPGRNSPLQLFRLCYDNEM